jgi:6-phosphofructokinase 2
MNPIITLTMNSSVDLHYNVARMESVKKLRASEPLIFPGGGGINVSRVIKELGAHSIAVFTAGGPTGEFLREMLDHFALLTRVVLIEEQSRISATIYETETGEEFRPTPVGPALSDGEWRACFDAIFEYDASYIVATGSLPVGVPPPTSTRASPRRRKAALPASCWTRPAKRWGRRSRSAFFWSNRTCSNSKPSQAGPPRIRKNSARSPGSSCSTAGRRWWR